MISDMTPKGVVIHKLRTTVLGNGSVDPLPGCFTSLIFMINTNKSNQKKGSGYFGLQFDGQYITAGKSWRQECEVTHHIAPAIGKHTETNAIFSSAFVFYLA